jgi:precorrin-3B synthase
MMLAADLRKGWCPGALRPMQSGDGLLLRVRPKAGVFSVAALAVIADTASRFGSGEIDLTNRGNLQLRGISDETYPSALSALESAGLIDAEASGEAVRNVVVDPLSGLDPKRTNVRSIADDLERALIEDRGLWALPGKFGFSFSGLPVPRVGGRPADIMVSAAQGDDVTIVLDGSENEFVQTGSGAEAAIAIAKAFLRLRAEDESLTRMKHAVALWGAAAIFARAGFEAIEDTGPKKEATSSAPVGLLAHAGRTFAVGIGLPFGRATALQLESLCETASVLGVECCHTGPERVLLFPVNSAAQADAFLQKATALELIVDAFDLRLVMDVCPGAPACRNASTETRRDAQRLLEALQESSAAPSSLHVSGCAKGCARRSSAGLTLVARNGLYDVIRDAGPDGPVALAGLRPEQIAGAIKKLVGPRHP